MESMPITSTDDVAVASNAPVAAIIDFVNDENALLLRASVPLEGDLRNLGRKLAFFLNKFPDASVETISVSFWAQANIPNASAMRHVQAIYPNKNMLHYMIRRADNAWAITVRGTRSHVNLDLARFFKLCKTTADSRQAATLLQTAASKSTARGMKRTNKGFPICTGYQLFGVPTRAELMNTNGGMPPQEAMAEIGRRWSKLSEEERKKWSDAAKKENLERQKSRESKEKTDEVADTVAPPPTNRQRKA